VKGAFTGAIATKKGRFELADGGTLFLDEIGEIQVGLQAKLLRVLQEKTFERVGDEKTRQVDVRIISATNRDVLKEIKSGKFREDLYYRLNVVNIKIPPLRERPEDIPELVEFFMGQFSVQRGQGMFRISPDALRFLQTYNFPGNIRELRNILERSCLLCSDQRIEKSDITPGISPRDISDSDPSVSVPGQGSETPKFSLARNQFEIGYLTRLLSVTRGNVSQASRLAGIDRNNFKDKLRKHGIVLEEFKEDFSED
jgi:DNA-binding NtrC family response regulator